MKATLDSNGEANIFSTGSVRGKVRAVQISYPASGVEVALKTDELVTQTILDLSSRSTDTVLYPVTSVVNNNNNPVNYTSGNPVRTEFLVFGRLKVECRNGTSGEEVQVNVRVEVY